MFLQADGSTHNLNRTSDLTHLICTSPSLSPLQFSSFFPDFLSPPIDMLASILGTITRLRHQHGAEGRAGHHHLAGMPSALGSDSADASRRRCVLCLFHLCLGLFRRDFAALLMKKALREPNVSAQTR